MDLTNSKTMDLLREVDRLGPLLEKITAHIETVLTGHNADASARIDDKRLTQIATLLYRARRKRAEFLPIDLLGEPAWDLILDLFSHHHSGKNISITSATIASAVSPTTGLRWISLLEGRKWIERFDDPSDKRRSFIRLTDNGYNAIANCLRIYAETL